MALTSSAKKAIKRSTFLRERNAQFKFAMKKAIKSLKKGAEAGEKNIAELYVNACSVIDKAAQKNIIHKKNAARKKSRLSALVVAK